MPAARTPVYVRARMPCDWLELKSHMSMTNARRVCAALLPWSAWARRRAAATCTTSMSERPDLSQLLRRQRDRQLHAGLPEPLQHVPGHSGRAVRRDLVRRCRAARRSAAWRRGRPCARTCPAICSSLSTLALAVVLYLGYASFVLLKVVCLLVSDHVCRRDRAVPRLRSGHLIPHDYIPRRAAGDLRVLVASPLAIIAAMLFFAGGRHRRSRSSRARASRRRRPPPDRPRPRRRRIRRPSSNAGTGESQPRVPLIVPTDGAEGADREVQRLPVPRLRARRYLDYKPILAKYDARASGRRQGGA